MPLLGGAMVGRDRGHHCWAPWLGVIAGCAMADSAMVNLTGGCIWVRIGWHVGIPGSFPGRSGASSQGFR